MVTIFLNVLLAITDFFSEVALKALWKTFKKERRCEAAKECNVPTLSISANYKALILNL